MLNAREARVLAYNMKPSPVQQILNRVYEAAVRGVNYIRVMPCDLDADNNFTLTAMGYDIQKIHDKEHLYYKIGW